MSIAPPNILLGRHRFKMSRIAASSVETSVIDFQPIRDRTDIKLVGDAVSVAHPLPRVLDGRIVRVRRAATRPTFVGSTLVDARCKPDGDWLGWASARVHPDTVAQRRGF